MLLLVATSGCAVGPDYTRPKLPINQNWTQHGDARIEAQRAVDVSWWKSFGDPALDQLIERAYVQNPPLLISGIRILEARAQLGVAIGQQYPSNQNPVASGQLGGFNNKNVDLFFGTYQVGFDAVWEIDVWGRLRRGVRAAKATYMASLSDYADALVSLTAEVARVYLLIRTYRVLIALTRDNVAVQEEGLRIAQARFTNGATSYLDVAQATTLLESTRSTLPEHELNLRAAQNALCTLLGLPSGCAESMPTGPDAIPAGPAQVAVSVPAELIRRRPDIRSAEFNAIAQCDRIGMAKAELLPRFSLGGALGTRTVETTGSSPSAFSNLLGLFTPGTFIYRLGLDLFWPLLNYPKILDNVRVQDARFQELLFNYLNTVLKAMQEVEDGINGFLREQDAAVFAEKAVVPAKEAVNLASKQYREGAVDYQRVLDAERALLETQNRLARTQSAVAINLVALYKALGGGWEWRAGKPVVSDETRSEMRKRTNWGHYLNQPPEPVKVERSTP